MEKFTKPISMLEVKQTERVPKGRKKLHWLTIYWIYSPGIWIYILRRINT